VCIAWMKCVYMRKSSKVSEMVPGKYQECYSVGILKVVIYLLYTSLFSSLTMHVFLVVSSSFQGIISVHDLNASRD